MQIFEAVERLMFSNMFLALRIVVKVRSSLPCSIYQLGTVGTTPRTIEWLARFLHIPQRLLYHLTWFTLDSVQA